MEEAQITLRKAEHRDCGAIHDLIMELAIYERAPQEVRVTIEDLQRDGFGAQPKFHAWVAIWEGQVIGMALYYVKYSTWKGPCVFLEDIIVTVSQRGKGVGKRLFEQVLQDARAMGALRMEWQVLDWNVDALRFYERYHPERLDEWLTFRIRLEAQ